jgi:PAS domain S-box-containing protein
MSTIQAQWLHQVGIVLGTLNQGAVISDEDRCIVYANSKFLEMGKMSVEEIVGRSVMDFYPPEDVGKLQEFIARREAQGRAQYEFYIAQPDGGRLPVPSRPASCMAAMAELTELLPLPTSATGRMRKWN